MIIGGYVLDLYCENDDDRNKHKPYDKIAAAQFCGHSRTACVKKAQATGWIINLTKRTAICPKCSGKKLGGQK